MKMNALKHEPHNAPAKQPAPFSSRAPQAEPIHRAKMTDFWVSQGWYRKTRGDGIRFMTGKWKGDPQTRRDAVRFLVDDVLRKEARDMAKGDFDRNRLNGLLENYYRGSPYDALIDAGYSLHPWELAKTPVSIFDSKKMRVAAVRWLVGRLHKDIRMISAKDFMAERLGGLLGNHYHLSPYAALHEARYPLKPWEMKWSPKGIFMTRKERVEATRWAVRELGKDVKDVVARDFLGLGLDGLLAHHGNSPLSALTEAGYRILPWEMRKSPSGYFKKKANRVLCVRWLVKETGKAPKDVTKDDFKDNSLGGLLGEYYHSRPYLAMLEAKLVTPADEKYMRHHSPWKSV